MSDDATEERIIELRDRIEGLRGRLPRHSVPTAMLIELEELEEELEALEQETSSGPD